MDGSRFRLSLLLLLLLWPSWVLAADSRVPVMPRTIKPSAPMAAVSNTAGKSQTHWVNDLALKASLSLNEFNNWQGGGSDSRTWFMGANGTIRRLTPRTDWATRIILDYGEVKAEGQGTRKNLDKIFLESVLHLTTDGYVKPFVSMSGQSQFAHGYDYDQTPFQIVSGFRDPLVWTQTGGVGRKLANGCNTRLGAAVRVTFTDQYNQHSDNPDTPHIEKRKTEGGFESVTSLDTRVNGTVTIKSRLELFMGFDSADTVDIDWDNEIVIKAWGALGVNYKFQLRFNEDIFDGIQTRQMLGVGLNLDLI